VPLGKDQAELPRNTIPISCSESSLEIMVCKGVFMLFFPAK
jgi:hypothetical protein